MANLFIAGLINLETTVRISGFPVEYVPSRFPFGGVQSRVSGVGYNLAKALTRLGHNIRFASIIGSDSVGDLVLRDLASIGVDTALIDRSLPETAQSAILFDASGRRMINADLKDIQDRSYDLARATAALRGCDAALICNINFARPLLAIAQRLNLPIISDVHAISAIDDPYNRDWMQAATILAMSHESLPCTPIEWIRHLQDRYPVPIMLIGLGADGALLAVRRDDRIAHLPAVSTRPVVNTIGAGDALLSAFVHGYLASGDAYAALRQAQVYASYKVGANGAAEGLLTAPELNDLCRTVNAMEQRDAPETSQE